MTIYIELHNRTPLVWTGFHQSVHFTFSMQGPWDSRLQPLPCHLQPDKGACTHNLILLYFLTLTQANGFDGLRREIAPPVIERLRRTYAHVNDIDLFSGNEEKGWRASLGIFWAQQRARLCFQLTQFPNRQILINLGDFTTLSNSCTVI